MDGVGDSKRRRISDPTRDVSISPPPKRLATASKAGNRRSHTPIIDSGKEDRYFDFPNNIMAPPAKNIIPSPIQLNFIEELPAASNVDTISLGSILGDPMIKECWLFNYLFDIEKHFDPDTRDIVQIRVVHGSWKKEDLNGIGIEEGAKRHPNVQLVRAYMPEMFGTHHSKMIVLFRHDDSAQVIMITANFIERDWRMSQAIWKTPLLPLQRHGTRPVARLPPLGSGLRFKHDLLAYFRAYGRNKLQGLINQLAEYNFSEVRGDLIASIPGKQNIRAIDPELESLWGWPGLKRILGHMPDPGPQSNQEPEIVAQVSSIAAIGEKWLKSTFIPALSASRAVKAKPKDGKKPRISIIFPTPEEIRRSLDGYGSGSSIHIKISTPTQAKQLDVLRPMLCHWAGDQTLRFGTLPVLQALQPSETADKTLVRQAGRQRAAPHIKTYIRFTDPSMQTIDWAMMTSANLSTQAWGAASNARGDVRICSYEIGVVVWPALWDEDGKDGSAKMVPVFKRDMPDEEDGQRLVGCRMPYDLPLIPYGDHEKPWSAAEPCPEPDWMGRVWRGYGAIS